MGSLYEFLVSVLVSVGTESLALTEMSRALQLSNHLINQSHLLSAWFHKDDAMSLILNLHVSNLVDIEYH